MYFKWKFRIGILISILTALMLASTAFASTAVWQEATATPVLPEETPISTVEPPATVIPTVVQPTVTPVPTVVQPTATPVPTVVESTATPAPTEIPPTATATSVPTGTPVTPTSTSVPTQIPPTTTATATPTQIPPTATATSTPTQIPPTATATSTPTQVPPTATPTWIPYPPAYPPPPPPPYPPVPPAPILGIHVVQQGEWLYCIGRAYSVSPWAIAMVNYVPWPYWIYVGQVLQIPAVPWYNIPPGPVCQPQFSVPVPTPTVTPSGPTITPGPTPIPPSCRYYHPVVWGDTLTGIAWRYGTTVEAIMYANPSITNPNLIYAGQTLCIP